jgi:hypothetical protein
MAEQTQEATIEAAHPPFVVATVDLDPSPKSNNLKVTVKGLGHKRVRDFRQAFLQVRQSKPTPLFPDHFTFQVVQVRNDSLVFSVRRVDSPGGWNQSLTVQILLVGVGETAQ